MVHVENPGVLASVGLSKMQSMKIRVNICRTGVLNFFVGIPGGMDLKLQPESILLSVCQTLLGAISKAT